MLIEFALTLFSLVSSFYFWSLCIISVKLPFSIVLLEVRLGFFRHGNPKSLIQLLVITFEPKGINARCYISSGSATDGAAVVTSFRKKNVDDESVKLLRLVVRELVVALSHSVC